MSRPDGLGGALAAIEGRVAAACAAAGRTRSEVTLVAVSKTWPASDVVGLHALGVRDFGENRDAEVVEKAGTVAAAGAAGVVWHFVGQVQSRKAAGVAAVCDVVHSVDRARLVGALSRGAQEHGRTVRALLQVDLSGADGAGERGGVAPAGLAALADAVAAAPGLVLGGVMTLAPREADPAAVFGTLAELAASLRADHPGADWVSAGMSGDLEQAVAAGATHLRVGTALFGGRSPLLG